MIHIEPGLSESVSNRDRLTHKAKFDFFFVSLRLCVFFLGEFMGIDLFTIYWLDVASSALQSERERERHSRPSNLRLFGCFIKLPRFSPD